MTIWEIDEQIRTLLEGGVNEETGELVIDTAAIDALQMEREQKLENVALFIKDAKAGEDAIGNEIDALKARQDALKKRRERAQDFLADRLAGEKFSTPKVAVSYRKSTSVETDADFVSWAMDNDDAFLRYKAPEPNKAALTAALKAGAEIPHARLVQKLSMQIR